MTQSNDNHNITDMRQVCSLADIEACKAALKREIHDDECRISDMWNDLFHTDEPEPKTRAQRITRMISMGSGVIDGALLGWKLYRKFKLGSSLFGKYKKSR